MTTADISMEKVGGRTLRVARWRLDMPSEHTPILFFNGIGANIEAIAPLAEALSDRGFIMFDMPGVGQSPDPLIPYNTATMAWTTAQLLDQFGLDEVDVMGMSWGGAIAQQFALQYPKRTRKLVLVATGVGGPIMPASPAALAKIVRPHRFVDTVFMVNSFETFFSEALSNFSGKGARVDRFTPPSPLGCAYQLLAMTGWTSAPALPLLKKDTLILMGDEDQIMPLLNGKLLNILIPNSELVVMEGGGHLFLLSHKDESVAAIQTFLTPSTAVNNAMEHKKAA